MYHKDENTGFITNMNDNEYKMYISAKRQTKKEKQLMDELQLLQTELSTIKTLMNEILERNYK